MESRGKVVENFLRKKCGNPGCCVMTVVVHVMKQGKLWIKQMLLSSLLLPTLVCGMAFFINFIAIGYHASRAIPFSSMVRSISVSVIFRCCVSYKWKIVRCGNVERCNNRHIDLVRNIFNVWFSSTISVLCCRWLSNRNLISLVHKNVLWNLHIFLCVTQHLDNNHSQACISSK